MKIRKILSSFWCGFAALVVLFGFSGVAHAAPSTTLVPYRMDASNQAGWWKPIEEFGGYTYMAYNAWGGPGPRNGGATDSHTVYIAKRAPNGSWSRGCLKDANGACAVYRDDIGHNQPTVAIDGHGYVHVFAAMHGTNMRYWRSSSPGNVGNMIWQGRTLPGQNGHFTYPVAGRAANGDVYMAIRNSTSGWFYRWDNAANTWSHVATFAAQSGFSVYPNDVIGDGDGNIHIAWEWAYGPAGGLRHLSSYMRYTPNTNQFSNAAGTPIAAPATTSSPVAFQPLEGQEQLTGVGSVAPGVQSAKLALNPNTGYPAAAYRYKTEAGGLWRVRYAEWDGSDWQRQTVYAGLYNTYAALDLSLFGDGLRVYYAKADTPGGNQAHAATRQPDGSWSETILLPRIRAERLSVIRRGGTDYLYLAAPSTHQLYFGAWAW